MNGVWIIHKLDKNNFELVGSTYVAGTYKNRTTGEPAGTKGYMRPGPAIILVLCWLVRLHFRREKLY